MGIARSVVWMLLMGGRSGTGEVVEELVWTEVVCGGGGSRGGTGALGRWGDWGV